MPFGQQVALPTLGLIEVFLLMAVVFVLTRRRAIPDLAARAPPRAQAVRETILLLSYAGVGQVGGWLVGPALGYRSVQLPSRRHARRLHHPAQRR